MFRMTTPDSLPGTFFWRRSTNDRLYPWHLWLDGRHWVLTPGQDFDGDVKTFQARCYKQAYAADCRLRTRVVDGQLHIQALDTDTGEPLGEPPGGYQVV